jgi:hypothetical protein
MLRGNAMDCYQATMADGSVTCLAAFSLEQAAALFHYHFPFSSIVTISALSDGFSSSDNNDFSLASSSSDSGHSSCCAARCKGC